MLGVKRAPTQRASPTSCCENSGGLSSSARAIRTNGLNIIRAPAAPETTTGEAAEEAGKGEAGAGAGEEAEAPAAKAEAGAGEETEAEAAAGAKQQRQ